ncbi:hypothetical protein pipiens_003559 [Culex pipiens pipiens]|uniref:Fibrinogen C-terminal domain-containing protein n=1 Tax=Culex pipiens pipiens TaxID=38569 RepID=A0ABD1CW79_CULPP
MKFALGLTIPVLALMTAVSCENFDHEDEHRMHNFQNSLFNIFERMSNTLNRNQTLTEDSSGNLYMLNIVKSLSLNAPTSNLTSSEQQQSLELRMAKLESLTTTLLQNQKSLQDQLANLKQSGVTSSDKVDPCQSANSSGLVHLKDLRKDAYCEMDFLEGGWIVFQQQQVNSALSFNLNWAQYRLGFGTVGKDENYWLGLEPVHQITNSGDYELAVEFTFGGNKGFARYSQFKLAGEADKYRLLIGGYSGTLADGLSNRNYAKFSTYDSDNDSYNENCAKYWVSAWWFDTCSGESALNYKTPYWSPLGYGTFSRMMIRRKK